jgi:hypothetical protein
MLQLILSAQMVSLSLWFSTYPNLTIRTGESGILMNMMEAASSV